MLVSGKDGTLAQSVEQQTENLCVPGSIPGGTTYHKEAASKVENSLFLFVYLPETKVIYAILTDFILLLRQPLFYYHTLHLFVLCAYF